MEKPVVSNFVKATEMFEESTGPTDERSRQSLHTLQLMKSIDSQRHCDYFSSEQSARSNPVLMPKTKKE
jgi:hypothetical protein